MRTILQGRKAVLARRALIALAIVSLALAAGWHAATRLGIIAPNAGLGGVASAHSPDIPSELHLVCVSGPQALTHTMTEDTGHDGQPQIVTDGHGVLATIWASNEPDLGGREDGFPLDYEIAISTSLDAGATWSTPTLVNTNGADTGEKNNDGSPSIATDGQGNWAVVWSSFDVGFDDPDIMIATGTDGPTTGTISWNAPAHVNTNWEGDTGGDYNPIIRTDGAGVWICVWASDQPVIDDVNKGRDLDLLFALSTDNGATWTDPSILNSTANADADNDISQSLATDSDGKWMVVYSSTNSVGGTIGREGDILFVSSANDGATWSDPQPVNANAAEDTAKDGAPSLSTDGLGKWHVCWSAREPGGETDTDLVYAFSTDLGDTWSTPSMVNSNWATDEGDDVWGQISAYGGGYVAAVWASNQAELTYEDVGSTITINAGTDFDLFVSVSDNDGLTWYPPAPLNPNASEDSGDDSRPQILNDGFGGVIVWQSNDSLKRTIEKDYDILYGVPGMCPETPTPTPTPGPDDPQIDIVSPADGLYFSSSPVTVSGTTAGPSLSLSVVNSTTSSSFTVDEPAAGEFESDVTLAAGYNIITASATNTNGTATEVIEAVLDEDDPVVHILVPEEDPSEVALPAIGIFGYVDDASPIVSITINGEPLDDPGELFLSTIGVHEGENVITVTATDAAGNVGSSTTTVNLFNIAILITDPANEVELTDPEAPFTVSGLVSDGSAAVEVNGVPATITATAWGHTFSAIIDSTNFYEKDSDEEPELYGSHLIRATATREGGDFWAKHEITVNSPPPPEPTAEEHPVDPSISSDIEPAISWIYSGENPIQLLPDPENPPFESRRIVMLRGLVFRDDDSPTTAPVGGAKVSILGHPEYGRVFTHNNGVYSIAVNGGGPVTVVVKRPGFQPAQRQVLTPWRDFVSVPPIKLKKTAPPLPGSQAAVGSFTDPEGEGALLRGSVSEEGGEDERRVDVFMPPGTTVDLIDPDDGSVDDYPYPMFTLTATEFTVGPDGPKAMPASLPPTSGYTYAVDLSIAEADGAEVVFDQPVVVYVDNFIGLPSGIDVPLGSFDPEIGCWVPEVDGRVITLTGTTVVDDDTVATIDIDDYTGDEAADDATELNAIGISLAERKLLAKFHGEGRFSLIRLRLSHFTAVDANYAVYPPLNAESPDQPVPQVTPPPCTSCGSIIGVEAQTLGEVIPVPGTPVNLVYSSERVPGYLPAHSLKIPLSGPTLHDDMTAITLGIDVAGKFHEFRYDRDLGYADSLKNMSVHWQWDGEDAFGRRLQGTRDVKVSIGYAYPGVYGEKGDFLRSFAAFPGTRLDALPSRNEIVLNQDYTAQLHPWDARRAYAMGGWGIDVHHAYDPASQTVFFGDGSRRQLTSLGNTIAVDAGISATPTPGPTWDTYEGGPAKEAWLRGTTSMAVNERDDVFLATDAWNRVLRIDGADGTIHAVTGGQAGTIPVSHGVNEGIDAIDAYSYAPKALTQSCSGDTFYFEANGGYRNVYRITDGKIYHVAKTSANTWDLEVGPDCCLYIVEREGGQAHQSRILRVPPPYKVVPAPAGGGMDSETDANEWVLEWGQEIVVDGDTETLTSLTIMDTAFGPDGSLYVAQEQNNNRILRLSPSGEWTRFAGGVSSGGTYGGPALEFQLQNVDRLAVNREGELFVSAFHHNGTAALQQIYRIGLDGNIAVYAGHGEPGMAGDGGPALGAHLGTMKGMAFAPNGALRTVQGGVTDRLRTIAPPTPEAACGPEPDEISVPSEDGSEIYIFDAAGRHRRTLNAYTCQTILAFDYEPFTDSDTELEVQRLVKITDGDGLFTTINRVGSGEYEGTATSIVGPFGQTTTLTVDNAGSRYLSSVELPGGLVHSFSYHGGAGEQYEGLLHTYSRPTGDNETITSTLGYDDQGRLTSDEECACDGGSKGLTREELGPNSFSVSVTTAMGRETTHEVHFSSDDHEAEGHDKLRRVITDPAGLSTTSVERNDETGTLTAPDGTEYDYELAPDPRFGMLAPYVTKLVVKPSGDGLDNLTHTVERSIDYDPGDGHAVALIDTLKLNGAPKGEVVWNFDELKSSVLTAGGRSSESQHDEQGRITQLTVPGLHPVNYAYDEETGQLIQVSQGTGGETRTVEYVYYDEEFGQPKGWLKSMTDPLGRTATFEYDTALRTVKVTMPAAAVGGAARVVDLAYDDGGNVTSITPPGGTAHEFEYDPRELPVGYHPPELPSPVGATPTEFAFNDDAQLTSANYPDGRSLVLDYDAAGRLEEAATTSRGAFAYAYDSGDGKLASVDPPDGPTATFVYKDPFPFSAEWSGGPADAKIEITRDELHRVQNVRIADAYATATTTFDTEVTDFDADDLPEELTISRLGGASATFALDWADDTSLLEGTTLDGANPITDEIEYNDFGEVVGYVVRSDGDPIYELEFERDKLGRITQKIEWIDDGTSATTKTWDYEYDNADRLTTVTLNGGSPGVYAYDDNGNRLSYTSPASVVTTGNHDAQDRLTSYGSIDYAYTAAGDLLTKTDGAETTTYAYDEEGNLLSVVIADGSTTKTIEYLLDAAGRRIGKKVDGDLVQGFIPGSLGPAAELDGYGRMVSLFFPGGMWSRKQDGTTWRAYRIVTDKLGSARLVVRADNGAVVQRNDYDEFGNIVAGYNHDFQPYGFAAGHYDTDTGLVRFGARDYDSHIGRWTTKDPSGFGGDLNFYAYCFNDPVNLSDPLGLSGIDNLQFALDGAGFIPVVGIVADVANAGISAARGNWGDAGLNLVGAIPIAGDGIKGAKLAAKGAALAGAGKSAGKVADAADDVADAGKAVQSCPRPKGGENPDAALGREMHEKLKEKVRKKKGWDPNPTLIDPATGKKLKPDALTPSGRPIEYKPNTPSGKAQGKRQLKEYERVSGKKGRVICYDK